MTATIPAWAITFDSGHIDAFNVTADSPTSLTLDLKEDITGSSVRQAPEDVVISVGPHAYTEATTSVPGVERPTWFLPLTQASDLPWPGWDTNGVKAQGFNTIDITFNSVTGPGNVFIYTNNTFGQAEPVLYDGSAWLTTGSVLRQENPGHVHANWAFDTPGTYQMVVTASGVNEEGQEVTSNSATYTFEVDPEAAGEAGTGGGGEKAAGAPGAPGTPGAGDAPGAPGASKASSSAHSPHTSLVSTQKSLLGLTYRSWTLLVIACILCAAGSGLFIYQRRQEKAQQAAGEAAGTGTTDASTADAAQPAPGTATAASAGPAPTQGPADPPTQTFEQQR
ncbi:choice-of-anchor M domain-containing protein [Corynebacterium atypicum]|uniref:choice-of-anchor M domain-containing protein n=1 Tax=Corynebacterium atypicum TaxID=191610 RepID=UPI00068CBED6|nr:choice-of-anchor M domain-containing protein [Corynebacterium atypicum]